MAPAVRIRRSRTAIGRGGLSRPVRLALESELIHPDRSVFDYGCGRGDDVRLLRSLGIRCSGWDPAYRSSEPKQSADIVNLGYVVNVIEDPEERKRVLQDAWRLTERALIVAARLKMDASGIVDLYGDGCVTARNTFQKYYTQSDLREWIEQTLGTCPVAAGPGVFLVFRDAELRHAFIDSRYRRLRAAPTMRKSDVLFERHRDLLEPLIAFITKAGRVPAAWELEETERIVQILGSIPRAFGVIRRVTGAEQWDRIRVERHHELLCYVALEKFRGRPRFGA
ncbi:MAG: DNA phosphorothioation-associated putative methyltransferase, partial [Planctomycetes bacterium]|nr:DNA phosphorothioation-associated putative methyltransferase [Planctomycetota bacterium]